MQLERKALYNLLRMNWLKDPSAEVEPWQVEDYRRLSVEELFERLTELELRLDVDAFLAYADNCESPEELADCLIDEGQEPAFQDRVYLLVFELWRQLVPETLSLSIFCDELDHQVSEYYAADGLSSEALQDSLAQLESILHQGTDDGEDPVTVFESVSCGCANDLEGFLYDYIAEQVDNENYVYASDMLDALYDYVGDVSWFDFLRARVLAVTEPGPANEIIVQILEDTESEPDLELQLDMIAFLAQAGDPKLFRRTVDRCFALVTVEDDFQDLLALCAEFFQRLDQDHHEAAILALIEERSKIGPEDTVNQEDAGVQRLKSILNDALKSAS